MMRKVAIAAGALALMGLAGVLAAPTIGQRIAESKVDKALKRLRVDNTAVVNRGEVSVDLWTRVVTVKDLTVDPPGRGAGVRIGKVTITRPAETDDQLTAAAILVEDLTVKTAGSTTTVPRLEIANYSGPDKGLSTTPGVGAAAHSQAGAIARVSFDRAIAPLIITMGEQTKVRRTIRNAVVDRAVAGVVEKGSISGITVEAPYLSPEEAPGAAALSVATGPIGYVDLSLPAFWRFYAGDGKAEREMLVKSIEIGDVVAGLALRPSGRFETKIERMRVENVETRSLGYALDMIDPVAMRARLGEAIGPAELRRQMLHAIDAGHAVGFDKIQFSGVAARLETESGPARTAQVANAEVGPYADWRLESARLDGVTVDRADGARLALVRAEAFQLDARGLVDYAERVGRDEVLLTTTPTIEEFVKITPRVGRIEAKGFEARNAEGALAVDDIGVDVNAPLDNVPQKVAVRLNGLNAAPSAESPAGKLLRKVELDALRGAASFSLVLTPADKTLALADLDYNFEGLGTVKAKGGIKAVDPMIALLSGAARIDKLLALRLAPFKFVVQDDGAVGALLRRAALAAGVPPETYRETVAREAQEMIFRVFGPPAESSAESAAAFIRDPRTLEITVNPRTTDQSLIEFIDAFDLGPEGIAQSIDVTMLYKR